MQKSFLLFMVESKLLILILDYANVYYHGACDLGTKACFFVSFDEKEDF